VVRVGCSPFSLAGYTTKLANRWTSLRDVYSLKATSNLWVSTWKTLGHHLLGGMHPLGFSSPRTAFTQRWSPSKVILHRGCSHHQNWRLQKRAVTTAVSHRCHQCNWGRLKVQWLRMSLASPWVTISTTITDTALCLTVPLIGRQDGRKQVGVTSTLYNPDGSRSFLYGRITLAGWPEGQN